MNRFVVLFALLTLVFAALFLADLQGYFNVARDPVAVIQKGRGTIRRLGHQQLTWDRASEGTLFGAGDTIATGESGVANLAFYAGGELELSPGAMVIIGGSLEELKLNFLSGTAKVRIAKSARNKIKITRTVKKKRIRKKKPAGTVTAGTGETAGEQVADNKLTPAEKDSDTEQMESQLDDLGKGDFAADAEPSEAETEEEEEEDFAPRIEVVEVADEAIEVPEPPPSEGLKAGANVLKTEEKVEVAAKKEEPSPSAQEGAEGNAEGKEDEVQKEEPDEEDDFAQEESGLGLELSEVTEEEIKEVEEMKTGGELVSEVKLPPAPEASFPPKDSVVDLGKGEVPLLKWVVPQDELTEYTESEGFSESKDKVVGYEVILRPAEGDGPAKIEKTDKQSLSLAKISRGKYLWSVRTITAGGARSPASDTRWLEVRIPAKISRPKILPVITVD